MSFGWAGAGAGAGKALEQILAEQMIRAQLAQRQKEAAEQMALQTRRVAQDEIEGNARISQGQQQIDLSDQNRRDRNNDRGLDLMKSDRQAMDVDAAMETLPPHLKPIAGLFKVGAIGKLSADDLQDPETARTNRLKDIEAEADIRGRTAAKYREPNAGARPDYQRVLVDGKETFLTPEEVRARGGVDAASRKRASTGMERQALGFYNRMKDALDTMDAVEDQVSERDLMLINNSPLPDLINNRLLSNAGQQYAQALQTYTEGRLRKESGAAIANTEYENDRKTVGRQANDQDDVRAQKKQTRRKTHEGIGYAAGPAFEEFYGEPFKRMESFSVKAPNGKTYTFKSAEEMAAFKAKAGIP